MELNVNLLEREKISVYRIFMGIILISLAIIMISVESNNQVIKPIAWFNSGILVLAGVIHCLAGFGFTFKRLFGKAYILIDEEKIAVKLEPFKKEQNALWNDVKLIEFKPTKLMVIKIDNTSLNIDFSNLDYALVQNIKKSIHGFADEKGL